MITELYIALGSALFGSLVMGLYSKLYGNGNGKGKLEIEIAKLDIRLNKLEQEVSEVKALLNAVLRECLHEKVEEVVR